MATWLAIEHRNVPILGFHAFRQTQTALTSYWACRGGLHFAYWTPVGGYPWSIPFEFPIYQWIVAAIACPLGFALDPVGRLVSYVFWIGCLWPTRIVCRRLFAARAPLYFWTFASLFISAPIYLFWGRSFLMESAALFFALVYVAYSLEMIAGEDRWRDAVFTFAFLTLAILQKSTTVLPLLLFSLAYLYKARGELKVFWRSQMIGKGLLAYGLSFLIGLVWVKYSDHVKMHNAFGAFITSSALESWNFGTLAARFSYDLWVKVIWTRVIGQNVAGHLGVFLVIAGLIFARHRRYVIAASLGLFLLFFMVFENLLFVHDYYPDSNTVYLIFAVAVSIGGLVESLPRATPVIIASYVGVLAINLFGYFSGPLWAEETTHYDDSYPLLAVAKFVREHTAPDDPLVIYGEDWSSALPYYGQRKAFAVPKFFKPYLAPLDTPEKYLDRGPSAILVCGEARQDPDVTGRVASLYPTWPKAAFAECDVYLRSHLKDSS
ncbi:hypothetical protein PTKU46_23750 [Paraburkholderia terrae]